MARHSCLHRSYQLRGSSQVRQRPKMLRVISAASGAEVAALDAVQFDAMVADGGATVGALKRHLAVKHFERKYSRFQLRILTEGNPEELEDDEIIELLMDLQLMLTSHLPCDKERDLRFLDSCANGQVDEVERSLKALQDPNPPPRSTNYDPGGPLYLAADRGHLEVVRLLLDAGADMEALAVDEWGEIYQPLHQAAARGHLEVVRLLIESRAEIDAKAPGGWRPLHEAVDNEHVEVVRLLLHAAADSLAKDDYGRDPHALAVDCENQDILQILHEAR